MRYINLSNKCILNAWTGDSKLEMGDGKRPLDVRGGGGQRPGVKNLNYWTKCNFSFSNMLSLSNPK